MNHWVACTEQKSKDHQHVSEHPILTSHTVIFLQEYVLEYLAISQVDLLQGAKYRVNDQYDNEDG